VLSYGEKAAKIGPVFPEIFYKIAEPQCISICYLFSAGTTGPIFIKRLHDIVALVAVLNLAYIRRYPISFLNVRATKVRLPSWLGYIPKTVTHHNTNRELYIELAVSIIVRVCSLSRIPKF